MRQRVRDRLDPASPAGGVRKGVRRAEGSSAPTLFHRSPKIQYFNLKGAFMLPVIVKLFDRFFRKIIEVVLFDPHTSTLMPALDGRRGAAVIISRGCSERAVVGSGGPVTGASVSARR